MNNELIREIATAIFADQILLNWHFYALIAAISLLVHVTTTWASSYVGKRAETRAMTASLEEVTRQLRTTTEATESVRLELARADWLEKEWRSLRRIKLEELMKAAAELLELLPYSDLDNHERIDHSSATKMRMLATLYFPELKGEVTDLYVKHKSASTHFLQAKQRRLEFAAVDKAAERYEVLVQYAESQSSYAQQCLIAHTQLDEAAARLMTDMSIGERKTPTSSTLAGVPT